MAFFVHCSNSSLTVLKRLSTEKLAHNAPVASLFFSETLVPGIVIIRNVLYATILTDWPAAVMMIC